MALAAQRLSPYRAVKDYLFHMLTSVDGLKAIILDGDNGADPIVQGTIQRVSAVESTKGLGRLGAFITEMLWAERVERVGHLKAVVWVRPVERNIALLEKELRDPKYGEYHIFFSNHTGDWREDWRDPRCESTDDYIERLAIADEFELVRKIGECYSDFVAVSPELFSLNIQRSGGRDEWHGDSWRSDIVGGVMSALLALRLRPVVRYASRSPHARSLAESIERAIRGGEDDTAWVRQHWERFEKQALKSFEQESRRTRGGAAGPGGAEGGAFQLDGSSVLLIVDRADDPITPLLHPWTYQAMIYDMIEQSHDRLLGNNEIKFRPTAPSLQDKDLESIPLSIEQDRFYRENRFAFWPEVLQKYQVIRAQYKRDREQHRAVLEADQGRERTLSQAEDHKERVRATVAHQYTKREDNASVENHTKLVAELNHLIGEQNANEVGALGQSLVFSESGHAQADLDELKSLLHGSEGAVSGAGGRSAEERYRAPLTVDEHAKERERLLVVFALRHQESLWKWPKAQRHGGVAAAAVKGGFHTPTKLGEELQALCEGGEEDLIHAMVLAHRDTEKVTPGLFDDARRSRERHQKRLSREEAELYEDFPHRPRLDFLLHELAEGKLDMADYTACGSVPQSGRARVRNIVVVGIGGVTFSEARMVHEFNEEQRQAGQQCVAVLGGDFITNGMEYLLEQKLQASLF